MKKHMKQQMYSKMYLITPMVYEKIKNHLDKSDLLSLTNINKPYFTPKIEFHGSSGYNNPPYPPYPSMHHTFNLPPTQPEETQQQPQSPPPQPPPDDPYDDFMRDLEEMDWQGQAWKNEPPTTTEFSTQTEPFVEQKPSVVTHEIQTETMPSVSQEIQTDPIPMVHQQTQSEHFPGIEQQTQTDNPVLREQGTQTSPIIKPTLTEQGTQTDPILKKIIPVASISTQTPGGKIKTPRVRKNKTPQKKNVITLPELQRALQHVEHQIPQPASMPPIQQSINQPSTSRELVTIPSRELATIPSKVVSTLKRKPLRVRLVPELMREYFQRFYPGRPMPAQMPSVLPQIRPGFASTSQPQPITYIQPPAVQYEQNPALQYQQAQAVQYEQPRALTYNPQIEVPQNYPVANLPSREIAISEPTYYVETPTNEPPGERGSKRQVEEREEEIVPSSKIIKRTYMRGNRNTRKFQPTHVLSDGDINNPNIDLPTRGEKKVWPCNVCGAVLSTKYNLFRHQARERIRGEGVGTLTTRDEPEPETQSDEFTSWVARFPAKRTSTQANFRPGNYPKRMVKDPSTPAIMYREWEKKQ
jgi:hypothetical protein